MMRWRERRAPWALPWHARRAMAEEASEAGVTAAGETPAAEPAPEPAPGAAEPSLLDWRGGFSSDLRDDPILQNYTSSEAAAKALVHAQRSLGASVQVPTETSTPDEWGKFYEKVGRPTEASGYEITPAGLPEGAEWDTERETRFREAAHAAGLTQRQVEALVSFDIQNTQLQTNLAAGQDAVSRDEGKRALMELHGGSTERVVQQAQWFFETLGEGQIGGVHGQGAWQKLVDAGLTNDVDVVTAFSEAGKFMAQLRESPFYDLSEIGPGTNTRASVEAEITDLMKTDGAYWGGADFTPQQAKVARDRVTQLNAVRAKMTGSGRANATSMIGS